MYIPRSWDTVRTLVRSGTLLLQHFPLSWLLSNFSNVLWSLKTLPNFQISKFVYEKRFFWPLLRLFKYFKCNFTDFSTKNVLNHFSMKYLSAFYAVKKWSTNASNSFLKRKMGAFASTNSLANQPIRGLPLLGLIWQNKLLIVPEMDY